jgi:hypothetical protein
MRACSYDPFFTIFFPTHTIIELRPSPTIIPQQNRITKNIQLYFQERALHTPNCKKRGRIISKNAVALLVKTRHYN